MNSLAASNAQQSVSVCIVSDAKGYISGTWLLGSEVECVRNAADMMIDIERHEFELLLIARNS